MDFMTVISRLDWVQVGQLTLQHLMLVSVAVGLAIVVGVPLGVLMTRFKWLAGPLQGAATVVLTIPSIALFGLMLPLYSKIGQGLGPLPAITAVFLYSLLPILRNTYLALTNVEPGIREFGRCPRFEEEAALVADYLGLDDDEIGNVGGYDLHEITFPSSRSTR